MEAPSNRLLVALLFHAYLKRNSDINVNSQLIFLVAACNRAVARGDGGEGGWGAAAPLDLLGREIIWSMVCVNSNGNQKEAKLYPVRFSLPHQLVA